MYLVILSLPLLAATVAGFLGRKIGRTGSHFITCGSLIITASLALVAFYEVGLCQSPVSVTLMSWIDSEFLFVSWGFIYDSLTVSMLLPVLLVSALVHLYSIGYMREDPHNQRFFSYLSMFTFFMLMLVSGDNYLLMFIGWEGVGISSYLLINFWFTRLQANKAAIKALVTNRIGDYFFSIGLFALFWTFGNLDYSTIFSLAPVIDQDIITIIGICLLLAAMGKSAQLGLHGWLPDAMEGPTPVSALIHAATLVTAGVYLLLRSSPILEYGSTPLILITWVGALTAFFAATTGLLQNDLKRVIAYSTMSQMGYLILACGLSQYSLALFHLVNHAFFKALLFLAAGGILHALNDEQDLRKMGGLAQILPFSYAMLLIGSLSLMALPFLTGYYSKDQIIESAFAQYQFSGLFAFCLVTISAIFTALYSIRLLFFVFFSPPNGPKANYINAHEPPMSMSIPLVILAFFSIFFGYFTKELFTGVGSSFWGNSIFVNPNHSLMIDTEFGVSTGVKLLPLFGVLFGVLSLIIMYSLFPMALVNVKLSSLGKLLYSFFNQKYYFDTIYTKFIINPALIFGYITSKVLDRGVFETIGPFGLLHSFSYGSHKLNSLDTGFIPHYALYFFFNLCVLIAFIMYLPNPQYIILYLITLYLI